MSRPVRKWGETSVGLLNALAQGPKTAAELVALTRIPSGQIAARTGKLREYGLVTRIDSGEGRGRRATYAITEAGRSYIEAGKAAAFREKTRTQRDAEAADRQAAMEARREQARLKRAAERREIGSIEPADRKHLLAIARANNGYGYPVCIPLRPQP